MNLNILRKKSYCSVGFYFIDSDFKYQARCINVGPVPDGLSHAGDFIRDEFKKVVVRFEFPEDLLRRGAITCDSASNNLTPTGLKLVCKNLVWCFPHKVAVWIKCNLLKCKDGKYRHANDRDMKKIYDAIDVCKSLVT